MKVNSFKLGFCAFRSQTKISAKSETAQFPVSYKKGMVIFMVNKQRAYDGGLIIEITGELDHHNAPAIKDELEKAIASNGFKELTFDLSGLTFMDSSGIGVLLGRYKRLQTLGAKVWIRGANTSVDKLLHMSGLYTIMPKVDRG